ncbi:hypothetical protein [Synechococcus sp. ROS8604]|uniref:hypothetical protein n=1 Tax=Synechococcus sp. ROS8604 TaxID=1442557 RepID=UPI001646BB53|nr:hypothetical protein [Synechococcus sp. ROS8604]
MTPSSPSQRWVPLLLGVLALLDLRVELQLLVDHLTLTSLIFAIRHHLLAVVVIVLLPSMWRHYRPVRRSEP